ncbi:MAG: BON domain-containing protein [Planctomycetia bacterium]|nr:BON domain-containing protein [Planctomycetia bacterium]
MRRVFYCCAFLLTATLLPMTVFGSNQKAAEEIAAVLQETDITDGCDIGLKYQDNTVWLTGVVDRAEKRTAIQSMVENVPGVACVVNQLEVEKGVITDAAVQQTAGMQRSIMNRPAPLRDIREEQIISDEVVSVGGVPVGSTVVSDVPAALPVAAPTPAQPGMESVMTQPSGKRYLQGSRPLPIKQASYGTTVDASGNGSVLANPEAVPYNNYQVGNPGMPQPMNGQGYVMPSNGGSSMRYDRPYLPNKAWPAYSSYPNVASVQYPKRHEAKAWPYIGPYYPYPQVPDGWRKVTLEWHDGYWHLDFDDGTTKGPFSGLFRRKP